MYIPHIYAFLMNRPDRMGHGAKYFRLKEGEGAKLSAQGDLDRGFFALLL